MNQAGQRKTAPGADGGGGTAGGASRSHAKPPPPRSSPSSSPTPKSATALGVTVRRGLSPLSCLTHLIFGAVCFQLGLILGSSSSNSNINPTGRSGIVPGGLGSVLSDRSNFAARLACTPAASAASASGGREGDSPSSGLLPPTMGQLFAGAARVNRTDLAEHLDVGVPVEASFPGNEEALVLYSSEGSFPATTGAGADAAGSEHHHPVTRTPMPLYDAKASVENCLAVKVLLLQPRRPNECLAIVGQWEDYHLHLFRRVSPQFRMPKRRKGSPELAPNRKYPLQYVHRGITEKGMEAQGVGIPKPYDSKVYASLLVDYLTKQESTLRRLEPVVKDAASASTGGRTVVVMLVNFGQAILFENFACAARSRGLDLSRVVMFATDPSAAELSRSLGVKVFDVGDAFGELPEEASHVYGDKAFKRMMMAKVYCVHLVILLGYDVLFQDVDVTWHRNPIEYFHQPKLREFDMIAQDDGARSNRYAPWSFNTGLYYVRANPKTVFFFNVFVRMGDVVLKYRSHQGAMIALINEHVSWKGLRVKIIGIDTPDGNLFPGGYHFHRRWDFMKRMVQGLDTPYLFHISWTESMANKLLFLKQLGEWFVQPFCENKSVRDLAPDGGAELQDITTMCCLAEPVVECHYRDKPSKIPCRGSPPIDRTGRSFW